MSENDPASESRLQSVTPSYLGRPDREMDVFGWGMFLAMLVILVPLLPFIVIVWMISKVLDVIDPR